MKEEMSDLLVRKTTIASLAVQLFIACITSSTFFLEMPDGEKDLNVILALEFVSQLIEFAWYVTAVVINKSIQTWTRYLDWLVSTPVMLLTTFMFFSLRKSEPVVEVFGLPQFWASVVLNGIMLSFGFALEKEQIPAMIGVAGGGVALVLSFSLMASTVDDDDATSLALFWVMYAVWFLYGVAAPLPHALKNICYNGLDIVSKNFYGLFLFVYVLRNDWFDASE